MKQVVDLGEAGFPWVPCLAFSPLPWVISVLLFKYHWSRQISKIGFFVFYYE